MGHFPEQSVRLAGNHSQLGLEETIFRVLDDDCSGEVSYIEFCSLKEVLP
jgi:hypothetical protein